jgi:hypothetical protein
MKEYIDYVLIPEGYLKDRIERLAERIYADEIAMGH